MSTIYEWWSLTRYLASEHQMRWIKIDKAENQKIEIGRGYSIFLKQIMI